MIKTPHDHEIERAYLSGVLYGGELVGGVTADDFHEPAHRDIYKTILDLDEEGAPPDAVLVASRMKGNSQALKALSAMLDIDCVPALTKQYAKELKAVSVKRKLMMALTTAAAAVAEADNVDAFVEQVEHSITRAVAHGSGYRKTVSQDAIYDYDRMEFAYSEHVDALSRGGTLTTGISCIDTAIRGVAGGEVLTIAARAGCFKTAYLQHLLKEHTRRGDGLAIFFSLEMPVASVFERYAQAFFRYSGSEVEGLWRNGYIHDDILASYREEMRNIIVIQTRPSLKQMERLVALTERKFKKKVSVIGIDYLGLVSSPGESEYQRNSEVAVGAKILATALNVPVILLAQLNRRGGDGKERVTIDMLRGSGQIEEAADFIFGLWKKEVPLGFDLILSILKNRKGATDSDYRLSIEPRFMRFTGGDPWSEPQPSRKKGFSLQ